MKQIAKNEFIGVVAEFKGQYWGTQYTDGQCTCNDFGPIEKAHISDPEFCTKPTDMTYNPKNMNGFNPDYDKLKRAKLIKIKRTTIFESEK